MKSYSLSHLTDRALLRELDTLVARDRALTAELLAHLAEVDARKLYLPAAYPSMFAWCVGELRLSEDAAFRRIRAARTARQYPAIFPMLTDGRLNLNAVLMLAPYLTPGSAADLLGAAAGRSKSEIERLLAERFPRPDIPDLVRLVAPSTGAAIPELAPGEAPVFATAAPGELRAAQLAPAPVGMGAMQLAPAPVGMGAVQLAPAPVGTDAVQLAPAPVGTGARHARIAPLAPGRFALQATIGQETHDLLRYAQALLGHSASPGDLDQVLNRALRALIARLEQQRFAATARSRPVRRRGKPVGRHIPAAVRREVWVRDGGQCTFVADSGQRCEARTRLEFDHAEPYARGGPSSTAGLRLRCRAHNQFAAEQDFGAGFMHRKREEARIRREARRASARRAGAEARVGGPRDDDLAGTPAEEVTPWLRALGCRGDEARRAAEGCAQMPGASLEQRVRAAIRSLAPGCARRHAAGMSGAAPAQVEGSGSG